MDNMINEKEASGNKNDIAPPEKEGLINQLAREMGDKVGKASNSQLEQPADATSGDIQITASTPGIGASPNSQIAAGNSGFRPKTAAADSVSQLSAVGMVHPNVKYDWGKSSGMPSYDVRNYRFVPVRELATQIAEHKGATLH